MNTITERVYPYYTVRDRGHKWVFQLTIKPSKRIYLQGISKKKLAKLRKVTASRVYERAVNKLANGDIHKPQLARTFYKTVFEDNAIAKAL